MDWKELIQAADTFARSEMKRYGYPSLLNYETSNEKGQELAQNYNVNNQLVLVGTMLMDCKLGQALSEGRLPEHVAMGVQATKEFLKQFNLDDKYEQKILECVAFHHGGEYTCKEAELCANADCYRFLLPKNMFNFIVNLAKKEDLPIEQALQVAKNKLEEKYGILSLDECKRELEGHYNNFSALLSL